MGLVKLRDAKANRAMRVEDADQSKIATRLSRRSRLEVVNDSHRHAGHASSPGTGESHFTIKVVSPSFAGKSRVERHRMVNEVLAEELAGKIHALAITALAPAEVRG